MSNKVINFGCRLNINEGERIQKIIDDQNQNNIVVINSCSVTNEAERQVRQTIRKIKKTEPDKKIIVTGCGAQIHPEQFENMKEVNGIISNTNKFNTDDWNNIHSKNYVVNDIFSTKIDLSYPSKNNTSFKIRDSIVVQQGCDHRCTFCIIPYGRGNNRSFKQEDIIQECNDLVEGGTKEITLTGVDISDYGKDLDCHHCISKLSLSLLEQTNLQRLRLSSIDCVELDDHFFELIQHPKFMPHLHLSLQSGDDMILKRMKRRHLTKDAKNFIEKCRKFREDITFGADIIAGFPTENEKMFINTKNFIENNFITHLHIFPFSAKKGVPASKMPQIEKSIIKDRAKILRDTGQQMMDNLLKTLTNNRSILIENIFANNCEGYDQNYIKRNFPAYGLSVGDIFLLT